MQIQTLQFKNGVWTEKFPDLDSENTALFLFGASSYIEHGNAFAQLREAFPKSTMVGCSSSGEIFGDHIFDDSLAVAIAKFDRTVINSVSFPIQDASQSFATGEQIGQSLYREDLTAVFLLSDGLRVNGSELARGINSVLSPKTVVTGGLAGDGSRFERTWVIHQGRPVTGYVTALALYGEHVHVGHGSQGGWDIFGPERLVTKSEGNVLYELNGKPALKIYKEYLGEKASELPASAMLFPLQIRTNRLDSKKLVRTVLSIDEEKQAMVFAGDIPQGSLAQLMRANFDRLIDGAHGAAKITAQNSAEKTLALAISCVGRRLVLGERTEEEVEATLETLPPKTLQVGFYSYGEISPFVDGEACELHNQTMTLTTISEDDAA